MIEVIVNNLVGDDDTPTIHLRVDGRVHEECNTDQIENKLTYALDDFFDLLKEQGEDLEYDVCSRCFPSG